MNSNPYERNRFVAKFRTAYWYYSPFVCGGSMNEILKAMEVITPQLQELETRLAHGDFSGKNVTELLGANPQLGFSRIVEFKATLDRMRGLTWVYMEAAANAGKFPAQRIPQALKEFLQQQATKAQTSPASSKKTG